MRGAAVDLDFKDATRLRDDFKRFKDTERAPTMTDWPAKRRLMIAPAAARDHTERRLRFRQEVRL